MAVITPTRVVAQGGKSVHLWETVTGGDTGEPLDLGGLAGLACAVQAVGTFGDTLTIQGSIDGTNWATLKDPLGTDATLTAAGIIELATAVRYIRPSAGASITDVDVYVCVAKG